MGSCLHRINFRAKPSDLFIIGPNTVGTLCVVIENLRWGISCMVGHRELNYQIIIYVDLSLFKSNVISLIIQLIAALLFESFIPHFLNRSIIYELKQLQVVM